MLLCKGAYTCYCPAWPRRRGPAAIAGAGAASSSSELRAVFTVASRWVWARLLVADLDNMLLCDAAASPAAAAAAGYSAWYGYSRNYEAEEPHSCPEPGSRDGPYSLVPCERG